MSGNITVTIKQGALRGNRRKTAAGTAFFTFQGVPYAKPPIGALRFKAPQPAESWTGIRDATKPGNQSVQFDFFTKQLVGDEDCLFLNVFTPRLPKARGDGKPLAVLVWIHGGGFMGGSSDMYDAEPYMDYDVVVVTVNYRVGALGFLSLGTEDIPGNAGLKDQVMALRWVKDNIATFGGDPNNVTIFGESAGGASVHYLVISPLSKGLFRRAIAQSGSAFCPWALSRDPLGRARRLAVAAGCDKDVTEDVDALAAWLQQVSAERVLRAGKEATTPAERRRAVLFPFVPSVEPKAEGAFLPEEPAALAAEGAHRVPLVLGVTSHEGILFLPSVLIRMGLLDAGAEAGASPAAAKAAEAKALEAVASDLERALPEELLAGRRDLQRARRLVERVKDFYFGGKQLSQDTIPGLIDICSDVQFVLGVLRAAREHARLGAPVFLYEFAFDGPHNFLSAMFAGGLGVKGVCHGDELGYQFKIALGTPPEQGSPEALLRRRLARLWTDFAKSGNPSPLVDDVITTAWLPYSESAPNYLQIADDLNTGTGLFKEREQFWKNLISKN